MLEYRIHITTFGEFTKNDEKTFALETSWGEQGYHLLKKKKSPPSCKGNLRQSQYCRSKKNSVIGGVEAGKKGSKTQEGCVGS